MNKIILKDGSEIRIYDGGGLSLIATEIDNYAELGELAKKLTPENLKEVKIAQDAKTGNVTGEYVNMALIGSSLTVAIDGNPLVVTFGLRELTEDELKEPAIATAILYLSDEQAVTVKDLFPDWQADGAYKTGDRV